MREKSFDSINVVPFIDIMLVLLTIVLATATFIQTGAIPVKLPTSSTNEQVVETSTITISEDGKLYFNEQVVTTTSIDEHLKNLDPKKAQITVWPDKNSKVQPLIDVMSLLKAKGFERVNIQTEYRQ